MTTSHHIIFGDSRQMEQIAAKSVHLVVTSPPYWQLKDYGHEKQIGFHDSYEEYINNLNLVWNECERVLHPGCRLCINIGDQFARSVYYGHYKVIPIRTEIIKFCETIGLDYMGAIIWQKVTTTNTTGGATIMGSFPYPRNGIVKIDYEFILIFKKLGNVPKPTAEAKALSKMTTSEWNEYFSGHWNFTGERQKAHLAMFPEELPKRLIRMFTFAGETVLDPFLGSGTTTLAAKNLLRNSIGYEINPEFLPRIQEKLDLLPLEFMQEDIRFESSIKRQVDFLERIAALPYIFHDAVPVERKNDPKAQTYGSKIDGKQSKREKYVTVTSVVSPEVLELSSGVQVRLLGVKCIAEKAAETTEFLRKLTRGQQVFLRYDASLGGQSERLQVYLYLKNKTFINAHLIKRGFASADETIEHRYAKKFRILSQITPGHITYSPPL